MTIVGCDFHPGWQQVAVFDSETGEIGERKLENGNGEAASFYRGLSSPVRVGFEACGNTQWFEDLLDGLGHEVWIGDAAEIRASYVRKQKTDRRDAAHILKLLLEDRFPRLWRPSAAERDLRQLLVHRHKLVGIRARVKNGLQHRTAAGRMGCSTQTRPAQPAQWSEPTDPSARRGYRACCPGESASAVVNDAARRRSDHGTGLRADHRGCESLSTRQAGGELSRPDSERTQLQQPTASRVDQQTGKLVYAHAAGRERANGEPTG